MPRMEWRGQRGLNEAQAFRCVQVFPTFGASDLKGQDPDRITHLSR
jgi:hypothetical protein